MPQYQALFACAETSKDRAALVFEEVDARKWGQLLLNCTIKLPKTKAKLVDLEAHFGLERGFRGGKRLDLAMAHELITNSPLAPQQLDIITNVMRTVDEKMKLSDKTAEIEAEILQGQFFQAMLTIDYTRLVRLIPRLRKMAGNLTACKKKKKNILFLCKITHV